MAPHFLLIRHAESEWNALGRWQGHGDPPLSARGRQQAKELAARLSDDRCDLLVASDLRRARETAEAIAAVVGCAVEVDACYRELDIGRWTGLTREQIAAREPEILARFEAGEPEVRPGGGESRGAIRRRARRAIEQLCRRSPDQTIAIVTHLGFIRALVPGAEPGNADVLRIAGATLLQLRREGERLEESPERSL